MEKSIQKAMDSVNQGKKIAEKSRFRPKFHFIAPTNWMNDPNGTIFYKNEYHLFYQHNPFGSEWGNMHWGHAKSKDLVYWEHLPIALAPSIDQGEKHCFSGCCVINNGVPSIIYTKIGIDEDTINNSEQWMATSKDNMLTWKKYFNNPIMTHELHGDLEIKDWRDPYVWRENNVWYAVLGGHFEDKKNGCVFLYRSPDLINWEYIHPLFEGAEAQGSNWECPNFFPLGNKYVLVVSPEGKVIYLLGSYDRKSHKFHAHSWKVLDHGRPFYATNTLVDSNGRLILFGRINYTYIFSILNVLQGWNGCISLPRILSYKNNDKLGIEPIPELNKLRKNHFNLDEFNLRDGNEITLDKIRGKLLEIKVEFDISDNFNHLEKVGFKLSGCENEIFIGYNIKERILQAGKAKGTYYIDNEHIREKRLELRIFIDTSIIEMFVDKTECITSLFIAKQGVEQKLSLFVKGGNINLNSLDAWEMKPINKGQ